MDSHFDRSHAPTRNLIKAFKKGAIYGTSSQDQSEWPVIPATVIRDLLRRIDPRIQPDPRGLRLYHVKISGRLNLDHLGTDIALVLRGCAIPEGITARHSQLTTVSLEDTIIEQSSHKKSILDLNGATLQYLNLRHSTLVNQEGPALSAEMTEVKGHVFLNELTAEGVGSGGTVRLGGASITGDLSLWGAKLTNTSGPALSAARINVGGNMVLRGGVTAEGTGPDGAVRLGGASITGNLSMRGAELTNTSGPALLAGGMKLEGTAFLDESFIVGGTGSDGAVTLLGADINGDLSMRGAELTNTSGPALLAGRMTLGGTAFLDEAFIARGTGTDGAVVLLGADIKGQLILRSAELTNTTGPALAAGRLRVGSSAFLSQGFTANATGPNGAVRLGSAYIVGKLIMDKAELTNTSGPVLEARMLTVGQDFLLDILPDESRRSRGVDLTDASIRGRLKVTAGSLPTGHDGTNANEDTNSNAEANTRSTWLVTGLTYRNLERVTSGQWLQFLAHGTKQYSPQPYQQLAAAARREGHENEARRALIAQHDDQLDRSKTEPELLTPQERHKKRILKHTVGYGYRPWRPLVWLLGIVVIAVIFLYCMADSGQALALLNSEMKQCSGTCQHVDIWILASDVVPLLEGLDTQCSPIIWHEGFFLVMTLLKLSAWAMLTLFIAGFTQIIRKPAV